MRTIPVALFSTALLCAPMVAGAFAPPAHLDEAVELQTKQGAETRSQRRTTWATPVAATAAWNRFEARYGQGKWRALWDADTQVPLRIYGAGIPIEGSLKNPELAAAAVQNLLAEHLELLAPGSSISDFRQVSNHFDARSGIRTIGFEQYHRGLPVIGGQMSVRIKNDRLIVLASEALPQIDAPAANSSVPYSAAKEAASWIAEDYGSRLEFDGSLSSPKVLPIISSSGQVKYHTVVELVVEAYKPRSRWSLYLDAKTGEAVARRQTLKFFSAEMQLNIPNRFPQNGRTTTPAQLAQLNLEGANIATNRMGIFTWTSSGAQQGRVFMRGVQANVINAAGAEASLEFTAEDGQTILWDAKDDELVDAQINTFNATDIVKTYATAIDPSNRFASRSTVQATVNIDDECNAFSDGRTINFFQSSRRCENTGRVADVVYHEYGHSLHAQSIIRGVGSFDGALSEGLSDYLCATINNDPGMGRGFFRSDRPLRHLDLAEDARWPEDIGEVHTTGVIYGGALWDLRKALVAKLGDEAGVRQTDLMWYEAMRRASDIPSTYVEVLTADDDDGNLNNGTPNICEINEAFARHGLADPETSGPSIGTIVRDGFNISLPVQAAGVVCPGNGIEGARMQWRNKGDVSISGDVEMKLVDGKYEGQIPPQSGGSVVQYKISVLLENDPNEDRAVALPRNRASTFYEFFVGETIELYCTDFESNPELEGWTHTLIAGEQREGANDWQWGVPNGTSGSGDPSKAFSGTRVFGNDLGGGNYNGKYQGGKTNALTSPVIDTQGHKNVRLQYRRWLTVEDGYFDQATILSNGNSVWTNLATNAEGDTHHEDREWRFHDVDLSQTIRNEQIQVRFQLKSDRGLEFGGWTLDDVCVVAVPDIQMPVCGDGQQDEGEACDDGNQIDGDGCEADCTITPIACGNGRVEMGEACDDGNLVDGDGCEADCTVTPVVQKPDPMTCADGSAPPCELAKPEPLEEGCGCSATEQQENNPWASLVLFGAILGLFFRRRN